MIWLFYIEQGFVFMFLIGQVIAECVVIVAQLVGR